MDKPLVEPNGLTEFNLISIGSIILIIFIMDVSFYNMKGFNHILSYLTPIIFYFRNLWR